MTNKIKKATISSTFSFRQKILNQIILHSSQLKDFGLFSGRMGAILFLMNYARFSKDSRYEEIADELLDEIWEEIHNGLSITFESGLCGIGWGIEYLIQNCYVEGNSLDICEEIDQQIMIYNPAKIKDLTLEKGIEGILHYILIHLNGCLKQNSRLPFDRPFLAQLYDCSKNITTDSQNVSPELVNMRNIFILFAEKGQRPCYTPSPLSFIKKIELPEESLHKSPIGLREGLCGYLWEEISETENNKI